MLKLTILYRGPLRECNYACWYCPLDKSLATEDDLAADSEALGRFVDWVQRSDRQLAVFFTPWGEALVRRSYQEAVARLTRLANVEKAAVQTNLSSSLDWIEQCDTRRLGLWCTYHPGQVSHERFLTQCRRLDSLGVRYSVGLVGIEEHYDAALRLREELSENVYLWINAYKDEPGYYSQDDCRRWEAIDPLFRTNACNHSSLSRPCRCGHTVVSVDGRGTIRPCHFIDRPLGNLYKDDFEQALGPHVCTNETCGCHIGYVHMHNLGLYDVYGEGILERIPSSFLHRGSPDS